jgi:hypothetical protein
MSRPRLPTHKTEELYRSKEEWHRQQRDLPIEEKLRVLLKLQQLHYDLARLRGDKLEWWQKPWRVQI